MSSISELRVDTGLPVIGKNDVLHTIVRETSRGLNGAIWKGMRGDKENIPPVKNRIISKKKAAKEPIPPKHPEVFTFGKIDFANSIRHANGLSAEKVEKHEHLSLKTVSQLLKRPVTPDEWVNFHLNRKSNTPIDATDPEISILYLVNWKKLKNDPQLEIPLDSPITREELEAHLKVPVTQGMLTDCQNTQLTYAILKPYLSNPDVSTAKKCVNFFLERPPEHGISWADLEMYLGRKATLNETYNAIRNRNLKAPLTIQEFDNCNWKTHINLVLQGDNPGRSLASFITLDEFKRFFPNSGWQTHFNCNLGRRPGHAVSTQEGINWKLGRPIAHPVSPEEEINWKLSRPLNHPVSIAEKVNARMAKDLLLGKGVGPKTHYQQVFGRWPTDWVSLDVYLARQPSNLEKINWSLNRDLDHPVVQSEVINFALGRPMDHPASRTEKANLAFEKDLSLGVGLRPKEHYKLVFGRDPADDEKPLTKYLGQEPHEEEEINWSLNRDLDLRTSYEEDINWKLGRPLDHPVSRAEKVNLRLGKDLTLGQGMRPKEHYQLVFEKAPTDDPKCLSKYLGRKPKHEEKINWVLGRDLAHPVIAMDNRSISNGLSLTKRVKSKPLQILEAIPEAPFEAVYKVVG